MHLLIGWHAGRFDLETWFWLDLDGVFPEVAR